MGDDLKGKASILLYITAIPLAFVSVSVSMGPYVIVALLWIVPDPRIESRLGA